MKTGAIVINSSSPRVSREIQGFIVKAQSMDRIYTARNNREFREEVKRVHPRLVFLETNCWYEATGYMIAQYAEVFPQMSIAIFGYERLTPGRAAGFINLGAESYVDLRLDDDKEITDAFYRIVHNRSYMPRWVEETLENYNFAVPEYTVMQRCEIPVLRLAALGNGIGDIALKLEIANGTVRNHISNIHRKFHIHTNAELFALALRMGLIHPDELGADDLNIEILEQEVRDVHTDKKR